ncbi:MAG TPA: tetratricopeptide repeat protein [Candidatus Acidoferrum sp.]|nr:tetratricopeptide repeat protein [Candidatus Acidoferrum sp.]
MRQSLFRTLCFSTLLVSAIFFGVSRLHAKASPSVSPQSNGKQTQSQKQQQTPPPQPGYSSSATAQAEANSPNDDPNAKPDPHLYDRYHAEQDIEVATFYIQKGDPDAAIPRLEEAARLRPDYGKPRLLLAECYEKKHDPDNAVKYLKDYLKVYPGAPDAKKVRDKIKKLEKEES